MAADSCSGLSGPGQQQGVLTATSRGRETTPGSLSQQLSHRPGNQEAQGGTGPSDALVLTTLLKMLHPYSCLILPNTSQCAYCLGPKQWPKLTHTYPTHF